MSAAKHTPGPWATDKTVDGKHHIVTLPDGRIAAYCGYIGAHDDAESQANARLIASAPELLAALQALFASALADQEGAPGTCELLDAKRAIEKATGSAA